MKWEMRFMQFYSFSLKSSPDEAIQEDAIAIHFLLNYNPSVHIILSKIKISYSLIIF